MWLTHGESVVASKHLVFAANGQRQPVQFMIPETSSLELNKTPIPPGGSFTAAQLRGGEITYDASRSAGTHVVELQVEDAAGGTTTIQLKVHVKPQIALDIQQGNFVRTRARPSVVLPTTGSPHGAVAPVLPRYRAETGRRNIETRRACRPSMATGIWMFSLTTNDGGANPDQQGPTPRRNRGHIQARGNRLRPLEIAEDVALFDSDNDGDLDAILADAGIANANSWLWENDGTGAFVKTTLSFGPSRSIATGDFDNDERPGRIYRKRRMAPDRHPVCSNAFRKPPASAISTWMWVTLMAMVISTCFL